MCPKTIPSGGNNNEQARAATAIEFVVWTWAGAGPLAGPYGIDESPHRRTYGE
jgi:hypothetical protein